MENKIKELEEKLLRKEQECDMWKNLTVDNGAVALKYQQQLDQLKAENEDLKIYIESNEQQVKYVETLVMDNDRLINELDQLKEQLEAYKMEAEEGYEINAELKAENDELRNKLSESLMFRFTSQDNEIDKLKQTLAEIKPILEYYANSTIGHKTKDGIYRIELSYKYGYSNSCGEPCYYEYNPKPAKEALRKINEVENDICNANK